MIFLYSLVFMPPSDNKSSQYEENRVAFLRDLDLLDTPAEEAFDELAWLATKITGYSTALISLMDEDRQWFKARVNFEAEETPRKIAFCDEVVRSSEPMFIEDATRDPRFADNPLVTGPPHICAYAGFPIRVEGWTLGTLCVIDDAPRTLSDGQRRAMRVLRDQLEAQYTLYHTLKHIDTEANRRAAELAETQQHLTRLQRLDALGRLAAGVAHDFNNILTVVLSSAQILKDGIRDASLRQDIEAIEQASRQAIDLTNQLLTFSRSYEPHAKRTDLCDVIDSMQRLLDRALRANITLRIRHSTSFPSYVGVAATKLEQILMNLVINARDAIPERSGGAVIIATHRVHLAQNSKGLDPGPYHMLEVRDTGEGIPESAIDKIFEPFFSLKDSNEGTGLGLATCYGIATGAGGTIEVESEVGEGTVFRVYLPDVDSNEEGLGAESSTPRELLKKASMEAMALLIVEDDEAVRVNVARTLEQIESTAIPKRNALEALLYLENHHAEIDVILTDLEMPYMSGGEFIEQLRRLDLHIPVVVLTGHGEDHLLMREIPADIPLIHKPFHRDAFIRALGGIVDNASIAEQE